MSLKDTVTKFKKAFDEVGLEVFLLSHSAKGVDLANDISFFLGCRHDDYQKVVEQLKEKFIGDDGTFNWIKNPDGTERALKYFDSEGHQFILAAYQVNGEFVYCPFTTNKKCLRFPVSLLNDMKKKRVGAFYFLTPTPVESYLEATFLDNGDYLAHSMPGMGDGGDDGGVPFIDFPDEPEFEEVPERPEPKLGDHSDAHYMPEDDPESEEFVPEPEKTVPGDGDVVVNSRPKTEKPVPQAMSPKTEEKE